MTNYPNRKPATQSEISDIRTEIFKNYDLGTRTDFFGYWFGYGLDILGVWVSETSNF